MASVRSAVADRDCRPKMPTTMATKTAIATDVVILVATPRSRIHREGVVRGLLMLMLL
jgi:hypothetical protein